MLNLYSNSALSRSEAHNCYNVVVFSGHELKGALCFELFRLANLLDKFAWPNQSDVLRVELVWQYADLKGEGILSFGINFDIA